MPAPYAATYDRSTLADPIEEYLTAVADEIEDTEDLDIDEATIADMVLYEAEQGRV